MTSTDTSRVRSRFRSPAATRDVLVLLLAFTGGCADAISYLGLGRIFTANMTGNTVLLGLSLAQAQWPAVLRSVTALAGYLVGVAGGALLIDRAPKSRQALWPPMVTAICAIELFLLAALTLTGAILPSPSTGGAVDALILLSAAAMGLQSVAVTALGIRGVATTYITGTWTSLISGLVRGLPTDERPEAEPPPGTGMQAAVVGVYVLAAFAGGVAATSWHLVAFIVPTIVVAVVVAIAWQRFRWPMTNEAAGAPKADR